MLTRRQRILFLAPLGLVLIPFLLVPALLSFIASFTNYIPFQKSDLRSVGLTNYAHMLADPDFRKAIRNIAILTVVTVTIELGVGLLIAVALRQPFRGRGLVRRLLLLPWLISPIANGVMWHFLFNTESGLINFFPAVFGLTRPPSPLNSGFAILAVITVETWHQIPLASFLILPGLLLISQSQWDQAALDGLTWLDQMRHLVLPRLRLLLLTVGLLLTGSALGTSESISILTGGGPGSETITPGLYSYRQAFQTYDWTSGATAAWLITASVLIVGVVYLFLVRQEKAIG